MVKTTRESSSTKVTSTMEPTTATLHTSIGPKGNSPMPIFLISFQQK